MAQMQSHNPAELTRDPVQLLQAFTTFNELSERLTGAYAQLETRIADLSAQLTRSNDQRQQERHAKDRLAERLGGLLAALPAGVVLVDGRDRIDRFNPAAERMFPSLAWGRRWREVRGESVRSEAGRGDWLLGDGRRVSPTIQPLPERGQILVMLDVTEQRQLEERLERRDRLGAMGEMAAQLAHQIRTPLSSALLYAGHLVRPGLNERQRIDFAHKLVAGLRHTEHLVADMLAFTRGGKFLPQQLTVGELVCAAIDALLPRLQAQDVALEHAWEDHAGYRLLGNRDALTGILVNLLDNAMNHGDQGMRIGIRASCGADGQLRLAVADDGAGVAVDLRQRIFDPFFTTRERGTGLGLAVVQAVVLEHGGQVQVRDADMGGAEFLITLPPAPAVQQPRSKQA